MNSSVPLYLKVFADQPFTTLCLQQWLDVGEILNAPTFIICEKPELIERIKRECSWRGKSLADSEEIVFFEADFNALTELAQSLVVPMWVNAAVSHLTTFQHALAHDYKLFWNIDADDTFFSLSPQKIAEALSSVQYQLEEQQLDACSLDMWHSHSRGYHWSFGVCLARSSSEFFKLLMDHKKLCHKDWEILPSYLHNLDYFLTFLVKHTDKFKVATFYVREAAFTHFGFIRDKYYPGTATTLWHKGKMHLPFIQEGESTFEIPFDTIEIDIGLRSSVLIEEKNRKLILSDDGAQKIFWFSLKYVFYSFMEKMAIKQKSFKRRAIRMKKCIEDMLDR